MSLVKIQGNASGTGIFTVAAPATNTDRTLTLPDGTGTIATAESTLSQFNASGSAPVYACRAWVNFNGTGTIAIRSSGNVSSITDNGVADYTVNFTTSMSDANYAVVSSENNTTGSTTTSNSRSLSAITVATGSVRVIGQIGTGNAADQDTCSVAIFR